MDQPLNVQVASSEAHYESQHQTPFNDSLSGVLNSYVVLSSSPGQMRHDADFSFQLPLSSPLAERNSSQMESLALIDNDSPQMPKAKRVRDIFSSSSQPSSPNGEDHVQFGKNTFESLLNEAEMLNNSISLISSKGTKSAIRSRSLIGSKSPVSSNGRANSKSRTNSKYAPVRIPKFIVPPDDQVEPSPAPTKAVRGKRKRKTQTQSSEERSKLRELNLLNGNQAIKNATNEIIVEVGSDFASGELGTLLTDLYDPLGVQIEQNNEHPLQGRDFSIITFKRKVASTYDSELDLRVPCPLYIENEQTVVVHVSASSLLDILQHERSKDHLETMELLFSEKFIYLVEGLAEMRKKLTRQKNQALSNKVREIIGETVPKSKKKDTNSNNESPSLTQEVQFQDISHFLNRLQVEHGVRVLHADDASESARWIADITIAISTIPYRTSHSGFADIDVGRVKSGNDSTDALFQSLQHIKYVTPPIAKAISNKYPNMNSCIRSLIEQGPAGLTDVESETKSGKRRAIGPGLATTLHSIFTSYDENRFLDDL